MNPEKKGPIVSRRLVIRGLGALVATVGTIMLLAEASSKVKVLSPSKPVPIGNTGGDMEIMTGPNNPPAEFDNSRKPGIIEQYKR